MPNIIFYLDKTEGEYTHFEGRTLQDLEEFLYPNQTFQDCCGTIICKEGDKKSTLSVAALKDYGVYVGFFDKNRQWLSLSDRAKLNSVLDVWGDEGLYVSEGLFISPQVAWRYIREFVLTGNVTVDGDWITPDDLPEDGNYI